MLHILRIFKNSNKLESLWCCALLRPIIYRFLLFLPVSCSAVYHHSSFFLSLDADTSAIAKQHELSHKQAERKSVYINDETKKNKGWRKTARKWKIDPKRFDFTKAARLFFSLSFQCVVLHLYSFWKNIELGKMSTFAVFVSTRQWYSEMRLNLCFYSGNLIVK